MTLQPVHHDPTPSVAALRKKGKVSGRDEKKDEEFQHPVKPSIYALDDAKRVEVGRKYWEQKEQWEPMNSIDWRELKSAKDFELGIGNSLYRHGTLSTWTDEQIQVLQREMENTLALHGDENDDENDNGFQNGPQSTKSNNSNLEPRHHTSIENASVATVVINNDVSISLSTEAASMLSAQMSAYEHVPYSPSGGGDRAGSAGSEEEEDSQFVDNIGKKGKKIKKNKKGGMSATHSAQGTDLALLDIASEIERQKQAQATLGPSYNNKDDVDNSGSISKEMAGHRRTKTEALRLKLTVMVLLFCC